GGLVGALAPARRACVRGPGPTPGPRPTRARRGRPSLEGEKVDREKWANKAPALTPPMWMLNHVPNMTASHSAILHDARGPNNTITQYDAAALLAAGEAFRLVQHGRADAVVTGGADTRTGNVSVVRYRLF